MSVIKITFNGERVGYVLVQWIGLEDCTEGQDYHKELFAMDSADIIHDHIEKGDPEFKGVVEMVYEIKDGFFKYITKDRLGATIKLFMLPLKYIHSIETRREEPSRVPMDKLAEEEIQKAR